MLDVVTLSNGAFAENCYLVFDPSAVEDAATYEAPHQAARGIVHVIVNGVPVVADGRPTDARPGRVLRGRR